MTNPFPLYNWFLSVFFHCFLSIGIEKWPQIIEMKIINSETLELQVVLADVSVNFFELSPLSSWSVYNSVDQKIQPLNKI